MAPRRTNVENTKTWRSLGSCDALDGCLLGCGSDDTGRGRCRDRAEATRAATGCRATLCTEFKPDAEAIVAASGCCAILCTEFEPDADAIGAASGCCATLCTEFEPVVGAAEVDPASECFFDFSAAGDAPVSWRATQHNSARQHFDKRDVGSKCPTTGDCAIRSPDFRGDNSRADFGGQPRRQAVNSYSQ